MTKANKVNITTGSPIVLVDEHGNELPGLVQAVLGDKSINCVAFPAGSGVGKTYSRVPHYNDVRGQKVQHWRKP